MSAYRIGRVTAVTGDQVFVAISDFEEGETPSGVPTSMSIDVASLAGPVPLLIGQPGTFVTVSLPAGYLLCMITGVEMKEDKASAMELRQAAAEDVLLVDRVTRTLSTIPIGTIDALDTFERGTDTMPTVNAPVFAVLSDEIDRIYAGFAEGNFSIGRLSLIPEQEAKINIDAFLSRHAAILGQTGGGKSWSVASIAQKIGDMPQATLVIFDLHGEYGTAFGDSADVISASELELPYWLMNAEELLSLMVDRSEQGAPNQIAKFKELLQEAKEQHEENAGLGIPKITIDTPVYFDLQSIVDEFKRLDVEMVPSARGEKQGPMFGQFSRLLMRLESRMNDRRYNLIFKPEKYNTSASMDELFRRLLGESRNGVKKLLS